MQEEPLYPFGYGLSYTTFTYRNLALDKTCFALGQDQTIRITVEVENTGPVRGRSRPTLPEALEAVVDTPIWELQGFKRLSLAPGENKPWSLSSNRDSWRWSMRPVPSGWNPAKSRSTWGDGNPDARSYALTRNPGF